MKRIALAVALTAATVAPAAAQNTTPHFTQVELQTVATFPHRPTGIAILPDGRTIVSLPYSNYSDPETFTGSLFAVAADGTKSLYPNTDWNRTWTEGSDAASRFVNVQSHTAAADGTVWVLDRGRPLGGDLVPGGAKLVGIDGTTDEVVKVVPLSDDLARGNFLNDLRVDSERGFAYVTDTAIGGVLVVDLNAGTARRALEAGFVAFADETPIAQGVVVDRERRESVPRTGDGIALSNDGETLFLQAHPWVGRTLYRVPTATLRDASLAPAQVVERVEAVGPTVFSDGIERDGQDRVHFTDYEHSAITRMNADGTLTVLAQDPRIAWPDAIAFGPDGSLSFTVAAFHQLYGGPGGANISQSEFPVFRIVPRTE